MLAEARDVVQALPCWVGAQARGRALDLLVELGANVRLAGGGGVWRQRVGIQRSYSA